MSIFDSKKKKNENTDGFFDYDAYISEKKPNEKSNEKPKDKSEKAVTKAEKSAPESKTTENAETKSENKADKIIEELAEKKALENAPRKEEAKADPAPVKEDKKEEPATAKEPSDEEKKRLENEKEEHPIEEMVEGAPEKELISVSVEDIKSTFRKMEVPEKKEEQKERPKKAVKKSVKSEKPKTEKVEKAEKQEKSKKTEEALDELKNVFDSALDEDINEIAEFSSEPEASEPIVKKSFKRNAYLAIGVIVSALALIGFISAIMGITSIADRIANNTRQKEEFQSIIYPLVITDIPEFEDVTQLSTDSMLNAAIWDILLHGDTDKYSESFENITIPQADVELHATKLFGTKLTFKHRDIGDNILTFYYDSETKSYIVPLTPDYFSYSPVIKNVTKSGDVYSVTVGYLAPSPSWIEERDKASALPEKYVEMKLRKNGDSYIVISCKQINGFEIRENGL